MADNYSILIQKLDEFIRKFYKNQLIKGGLYTFAVMLAFFLTIIILENFAHFGIVIRSILFYSYLGVNFVIISKLIAIPLFKLYKIGKIISHDQAAEIIGNHFTEVKDKLINIIQLKSLSETKPGNNDLVIASINQKTLQIKPIPFTKAIDFRKNRKYIKYALIPVFVILILLVTAPGIITDSTKRILKHGTFFEEEAPFQFNIQNKKLEALQHEDYELEVKLTGNPIPVNVFIEIENVQYQLSKENPVNFNHRFKNIQKDTKFQLVGDGFKSKEYTLKVLAKPIILNFEVSLTYPSYVNKKDEILQNTGDLLIPQGTKINWKIQTKDTKNVLVRFNDKKLSLERKGENSFGYSAILMSGLSYSIVSSNEYLTNKDSLNFSINVIPDVFPSIKVDEFKDSVYEKQLYYKGMIKDDYGFSKLTFNYKRYFENDSTGKQNNVVSKTIPISSGMNQQQFMYYFDLASTTLLPGEQVEYYFEVWDNDGVNGSKATRSQKKLYKSPTQKEIEQNNEKSTKKIESDMDQAIKDAKDIQKQIEELNKKLNEKKSLSWQEKKQIQDLLDKQKQLQNKVENIKQQNEQKSIKENQNNPQDEDLLKKQEQLNKLFEDVMTPEMKDLLKQFQDMLEKMDKSKVSEMMEKMKMDAKDIEKELDRNLEIFKQLELEKKINEVIEKLDNLSKDQENLSKETENKDKKDNDNLQKKQEDLNQQYQDLKKDLKQLDEKNKELEEPKNLKNNEEKQNDIQKEMENSSNNLKSNKNKKAAESQKKASEKMKELSEELNKAQQDNQEEEASEDIDALRTILENLIQTSFDQEALMKKVAIVKTTDPLYVKLIQQQNKIKDNLQMIEDSLFALSKRQAQIESFVNREIADINQNSNSSIESLTARQPGLAVSKQQFTMTSINNLALMLAEALQQMQKQQKESQQKKSGSCKKPKPGSCSKPGSGKPSFNSMKQMQQALNKQMEEMKNGKKPNGKQGQGQQGNQTMSEQYARMAAQQEAIRKQLQKMNDELKKEGKNGNGGNINKLVKDMEQTETDLVNKMISAETIKRQQEILTRLLESEKADKEREQDEKRQSNEAKNENFSNPNAFFEYKRIKTKEVELLKTVPASMTDFYKKKVNEYFYSFEN
ncbi:MAG: DUF4175 domain-containing protein [Bacteroidetes bacterium]|nr:DUF4175 domain-containing protein [Bacteroidota bacterium]